MSTITLECTVTVTYLNRGSAGRNFSQLIVRQESYPALSEPIVVSLCITPKASSYSDCPREVRLTAGQARHLAAKLLDFAGAVAAVEPDIIEDSP